MGLCAVSGSPKVFRHPPHLSATPSPQGQFRVRTREPGRDFPCRPDDPILGVSDKSPNPDATGITITATERKTPMKRLAAATLVALTATVGAASAMTNSQLDTQVENILSQYAPSVSIESLTSAQIVEVFLAAHGSGSQGDVRSGVMAALR